MRFLLLSFCSLVAALTFAGCCTLGHERIAPAVYAEDRSGASYWTLTLDRDGRYFLTRMSPDQTPRSKEDEEAKVVYLDSERGSWKLEEKKLSLRSDAGALRSFSVHHDLGGQYLEDDAHTFPNLRWSAEEPTL
jgi:hypothetical protein